MGVADHAETLDEDHAGSWKSTTGTKTVSQHLGWCGVTVSEGGTKFLDEPAVMRRVCEDKQNLVRSSVAFALPKPPNELLDIPDARLGFDTHEIALESQHHVP